MSVIGEVKKTGRHELKGRATVLDILAMVEGLGIRRRGRIKVCVRGETMRQIPFNYNKVKASNGAWRTFVRAIIVVHNRAERVCKTTRDDRLQP